MRRELSLVGASLVVYACALVLGTLVICGTGHASEIVGEWATQGNAAHVRIERCSATPELLCGLVTWLWEPTECRCSRTFEAAPTVRRWKVGSTTRRTDARIAQR